MKKQSLTLLDLVNNLPDPDENGMLTDINKQDVENIIAEIYKGGKDSIIGLIDMLVEKDIGEDFKPRYALHCLALHVCKLKDQKPQLAFSKLLAEKLDDNLPKKVKRYIIQELQAVGGKESIPALGKLLHDNDLYEHAALAITSIGGEKAAEQFRNALPNARGKCRLTILQNLGVLCDSKSVNLLKNGVDNADREIHLIAIWGLANIGDASAVDLLLNAADTEIIYERIKATHACFILAENLLASGDEKNAKAIYTHLVNTRTDKIERYVYGAAKEALEKIG